MGCVNLDDEMRNHNW